MGTKIHTGDGESLAFLNHHDLTCAVNAADVSHGRNIVNAKTLCGNDRVAGEHDSSASFGGYQIMGADEWDEEAFAEISEGGLDYYLVVPGGANGNIGRLVAGYINDQPRTMSSGDLGGLNGSIDGKDLSRVMLLNGKEVVTGTGAETGQNVGIVASDKTFAALILVSAESALTTMTVQLDQSSDDAAADAYAQLTGLSITVFGSASAGTDEVTFTGIGGAYITASGATEAWVRANVTAFTGTSATLTAAAGVIADND